MEIVELMARGLQIASPIVAAMFIVQLGMGLIARSATQIGGLDPRHALGAG